MANYTPNKKNLRERADYGVRVARPGFDANTCADNQLIFNSGWPILQITKVIKESDMVPFTGYQMQTTVTIFDIAHYQEVSETTTVEEVSSPPEGYMSTSTSAYTPDDKYRSISVNKKYIQMEVSGNRTYYTYPITRVVEGDYQITTQRTCHTVNMVHKTHGLGYAPFFLVSDDISDVTGYILLTTIDIATDVDYPYTEASLPMLTAPKDYGIKSSSVFGKRVPGLCTGMFSKLVQAVKTQATSKGTDEKRSIWSPVLTANDAKDGILLPYEFYSFIGNTADDTGIDGGCYYTRDYPFYITRGTGDDVSDAWAVSVGSYQTLINNKNSLVVLRSPMVSPEYETRNV